jgi:hypothetical protein
MALVACAGRSPQPVAVVQPQDRYTDCAAIAAEVQANNQKVQELASDEGAKVAQNVAAGVAGLFIWPLWFAMDFQGTASKEVTALQSRQQYLGILAEQKRCGESSAVAAKGFVNPAPVAVTSTPTTTVPAAASTPAYPPSSVPTAVASSATARQTVLSPVTINDPYQPHWTVGTQ